MPHTYRVVVIGAGRVASNLIPALLMAGHDVVAVYRRHAEAGFPQAAPHTFFTDKLSALPTDADVYIISVSDGAIASVVAGLPDIGQALLLHTAGSVPMAVLQGKAARHGVLYPLQTFSVGRTVDWSEVSLFVEGSDDATLRTVHDFAATLSPRVFDLGGEARKRLHLAAVFACNFVNHCYALGAEVLAGEGVPFDVLLPLVRETARKVETIAPCQAQTGPAVRGDQAVMQAQRQMLGEGSRMERIYTLLSESIAQTNQETHNTL